LPPNHYYYSNSISSKSSSCGGGGSSSSSSIVAAAAVVVVVVVVQNVKLKKPKVSKGICIFSFFCHVCIQTHTATELYGSLFINA
jgi:hypothetical protein